MEGTVSITITESPPRAVHGGTREEVKTINEFTFDLQRFGTVTFATAEEFKTYLSTNDNTLTGGNTYKFTKAMDVQLDSTVKISDGAVSINFNNLAVNISNATGFTGTSLFEVDNTGLLKIQSAKSNDCKISSNLASTIKCDGGLYIASGTGKLVIEGTTCAIDASNYGKAKYSTNDGEENYTTMYASSTIKATNGVAIKYGASTDDSSPLIITGGTIEGTTAAIEILSGSVTIDDSGGNFSANAIPGNAIQMSGGSLTVSKTKANYATSITGTTSALNITSSSANVKIEGGDFTGNSGISVTSEQNPTISIDVDEDKAARSSFSGDVSSYLAQTDNTVNDAYAVVDSKTYVGEGWHKKDDNTWVYVSSGDKGTLTKTTDGYTYTDTGDPNKLGYVEYQGKMYVCSASKDKNWFQLDDNNYIYVDGYVSSGVNKSAVAYLLKDANLIDEAKAILKDSGSGSYATFKVPADDTTGYETWAQKIEPVENTFRKYSVDSNFNAATTLNETYHVASFTNSSGTTRYYVSLAAAMSAATAGGTVKLLKSQSISGVTNRFDVAKNITLDLNGFTLTGNTAYFNVTQGTTFKITDSSTDAAGKFVGAYGNAALVMVSGGTFEMDKGTIEGTGTTSAVWVKANGTANISGTAELKAANSFALTGNGTTDSTSDNYGNNTVITVSGNAKITSTGAPAIYHPQVGGKLTISDNVEISGTTGVEIRAGELTISGNTKITGTADTYTSKSNTSGSTSAGAGIAVAQHTTEKEITVNISGDTTVTGAVAVAVSNPQSNENNAPVVNISGGTFNGKSGTDVSAENTDDRVIINVTGGTFNNELVTGLNEKGTSASAALGYNISGNSATFYKNS